jgi:hypothetical protein
MSVPERFQPSKLKKKKYSDTVPVTMNACCCLDLDQFVVVVVVVGMMLK